MVSLDFDNDLSSTSSSRRSSSSYVNSSPVSAENGSVSLDPTTTTTVNTTITANTTTTTDAGAKRAVQVVMHKVRRPPSSRVHIRYMYAKPPKDNQIAAVASPDIPLDT